MQGRKRAGQQEQESEPGIEHDEEEADRAAAQTPAFGERGLYLRHHSMNLRLGLISVRAAIVLRRIDRTLSASAPDNRPKPPIERDQDEQDVFEIAHS